MNIALLAPNSVPYTKGGLEYLVHGVHKAIGETKAHNVEVFQLPVVERDFWTLMHSYDSFFELNLDHFDMCVSFKYPTWILNHPNHVVYMAHPLRGVYDTYHLFGMPEVVGAVAAETRDLLSIGSSLQTPDDVKGFFVRCFELESESKKSSKIQRDFSFPGPVARSLVHALDSWAFSHIRRFGAISNTVAGRKNYFPTGAKVDIVYPPSTFSGLRREHDEGYLLSISRLDRPKRVDLMISAMKSLDHGKLIVAGDGPERESLKRLSGGDPRIEFRGRVTDEEAIALYSRCRAVVYIPLDEDYGLTTLDAFSSGKPVITCSDSGGVLEFVRHNHTGLVSSPEIGQLSKSLQFALSNPEVMQKMGRQGQATVKHISWEEVVAWLINQKTGDNTQGRISAVRDFPEGRQSTVVLSTFPVYPPQNGGQLRSYHLYKSFSALGKVTIVSLAPFGPTMQRQIAEGVTEIVIGRTERHILEESRIEAEVGVPITDIVAAQLIGNTPEFQEILERELPTANTVILSHPYLTDLIPQKSRHFSVLLDEHNVESVLKRSTLPDNRVGRMLLDLVRRTEKASLGIADCVFTCTDVDKQTLVDEHGVDESKITVVPNGVDITSIPFVDYDERVDLRGRIEIKDPIGLFVGSWHQPNIEAARYLFEYARRMPDVHFIIAGSVAKAVRDDGNIPKNVGLLGDLDDDTKAFLLGIATVAVHPMFSGSGSNLKVLEYMASGLPIISSSHGIRGIPPRIKQHIAIVDESDRFVEVIYDVINREGQIKPSVEACRKFIINEMNWNKISERAVAEFTEIIKSQYKKQGKYQ